MGVILRPCYPRYLMSFSRVRLALNLPPTYFLFHVTYACHTGPFHVFYNSCVQSIYPSHPPQHARDNSASSFLCSFSHRLTTNLFRMMFYPVISPSLPFLSQSLS